MQLAQEGRDGVLADAGLPPTTSTTSRPPAKARTCKFATGHFYSMTTHARGGVFLHPGISAVVDIGALNGRAIYVDERGKVLAYKMTSQCASGSGQFLENIARYLGVAVEEIGPLSKTSTNPEKCSSICAVLAETDVINMVSRGIATPDVLKGIHLSMASRIVKLLKVTGIKQGTALVTGGLGARHRAPRRDPARKWSTRKSSVQAISHPDSIYAGAIGAALWGAFRHARLNEAQQRAAACARRGRVTQRTRRRRMALLINDNCTACDACKPVCPNEAISVGDPDLCHRSAALHRMRRAPKTSRSASWCARPTASSIIPISARRPRSWPRSTKQPTPDRQRRVRRAFGCRDNRRAAARASAVRSSRRARRCPRGRRGSRDPARHR